MHYALVALTALFMTLTPPSVAQDTGNKNTYIVNPTSKICSKITDVENLVTGSGEILFLTSKSKGDSDDFKINVYVNQKEKRFTIVKTFAKRNQACIIMSGYDIQFKRYSNDQKDEPNE